MTASAHARVESGWSCIAGYHQCQRFQQDLSFEIHTHQRRHAPSTIGSCRHGHGVGQWRFDALLSLSSGILGLSEKSSSKAVTFTLNHSGTSGSQISLKLHRVSNSSSPLQAPITLSSLASNFSHGQSIIKWCSERIAAIFR